MTPEQKARAQRNTLLTQAGWHVCGMADAHIHAARGLSMAKKEGNVSTGVKVRSAKYVHGLTATLVVRLCVLPFTYDPISFARKFRQLPMSAKQTFDLFSKNLSAGRGYSQAAVNGKNMARGVTAYG
jgi:hypothetical protein